MLNQWTESISLKAAVAQQTTSKNGKTSLATQLSLKTTNALALVQPVVNVGAVITFNNVPQKERVLGILGHFAKKFQNPKKSHFQTPQYHWTNVSKTDATATKINDEESVNYITNYQQLCEQLYDSNYDINFDYYVAAISTDAAYQHEALNAKM